GFLHFPRAYLSLPTPARWCRDTWKADWCWHRERSCIEYLAESAKPPLLPGNRTGAAAFSDLLTLAPAGTGWDNAASMVARPPPCHDGTGTVVFLPSGLFPPWAPGGTMPGDTPHGRPPPLSDGTGAAAFSLHLPARSARVTFCSGARTACF